MSAVTGSERELLTFGLKLLKVTGLNPNQHNSFAKIKAFVGSTMCLCCFILIMTEFAHQKDMLAAFQDIGEHIATTYQTLIKILSLLTARNKLQMLTSKIFQFKNIVELESKLRDEIQINQRKIGKAFKLYHLCFLVAGVGLCLIPYMTQDKGIPFPMYNFINLKKSPQYEVAFSWGCVSYIFMVYVVTGWDITFYSMVTYIYWEFKIIKHEFQNLKISEKDVQNKLFKIIRHHELVLSCVPDLNAVCSMTFLNQFLTSMIATCASLFILSEGFTFPLLVQQSVFLMAVLGQLFFASLTGSLLTEQSQSVAMSILHAPLWLDAPNEMKKYITMIILRSQRYEGLTMGGMCNVDLRLFGSALKVCLSFLNAIIALKRD